MFNATDFTYDGTFSGVYGLKIASINSSVIEETTYLTPTIVTAKPVKAKRFYFQDLFYESPPTVEFSVLSDTIIPETLQREILLWLDCRRGFKPLLIHQSGLDEYTYQCIFNVTSLIYHAGNCIGYNLQATFDSPYHYKYTKAKTYFGTGEEQIVEVYNGSDIIDDYVYPIITFTATDYFDSKCSISVVNKTDNEAREFKFLNTPQNITINVDNELKMITSEVRGDFLDKFEGKNWLRLLRGRNVLKLKIKGKFTIEIPQYIKIRF